jgi:lipid-A-disaccharide synthase
MSRAAPLIYMVACEPSADQLGAALMTALTEETAGKVRFAGIGGARMIEAGLRSLFDPKELALLGIFEVLPAFHRVLARVDQTLADITMQNPDVLVTIDSWGFTGRIHQRLARSGSTVPRARYVAPQVWAWRPGRAKQLAKWIHHLMTLFPFEPPYFTRHGLPATWVGHPVVESGAGWGNEGAFRKRHEIAPDRRVLTVLPGSRNGEIDRLASVFGAALSELKSRGRDFTAVVPTVAGVSENVRAQVKSWTVPTLVVDSTELYDAAAASRAAIAASGTVSLELAMAGVPHVVAYRVNPLSALAFRMLRKTRYVNLVNVLLDREAVPELLQENCTPARIADAVIPLLEAGPSPENQKLAFREAITKLAPAGETPSRLAARTVLSLIK